MVTTTTLANIFGNDYPAGATSFCTKTIDGQLVAGFCIGASGNIIDVPVTARVEHMLRALCLLGTHGHDIMDGPDDNLSWLMTQLASAIKAERKARKENYNYTVQQMWEEELDDRLEALALRVLHGVAASSYADTRDRQVETINGDTLSARNEYMDDPAEAPAQDAKTFALN